MIEEDGNYFIEISSDPLENVTRLIGVCAYCGKKWYGNVISPQDIAFVECRCGEIVKVYNKTIWH